MNQHFRDGFEKTAAEYKSRRAEVGAALKSKGNYKIKSGDTLSGIAKSKGTTVDNLMKSNPHIANKNRIYAGGNLSVNDKAQAAAAKASPKPKSKSTPVASGRTIMRRHGPNHDPSITDIGVIKEKDPKTGLPKFRITTTRKGKKPEEDDKLKRGATGLFKNILGG